MSHLTVVAAYEALEAGDVNLATAILHGAIEADVNSDRRRICGICKAAFLWPGELDDHERNVHFDHGGSYDDDGGIDSRNIDWVWWAK